MSGMNSGLDTESIINALTANTKLKATKQERNVLKYEATQEAYRDIISKMQSIKNKYFDILNKDSYLSGASIWNKYAATTVNSKGIEQAGLSVATSINSQPGEYTIKVKENAKQAKAKGAALTSREKPDLTSVSGEDNAGSTYGITVTVGGVEKNIQFVAGANETDTRKNLNQALEDAFGESNASRTVDGVDGGVEGLVYVSSNTEDGTFGQIISREGKSVSFSGIGAMQADNTLQLADAATGTNTITFQVGNETVNASFQTIDSHYFDDIFDSNGNLLDEYTVSDESRGRYTNLADVRNQAWDDKVAELAAAKVGADASAEDLELAKFQIGSEMSYKRFLYTSLVSDYKEGEDYKKFTAWVEDNKNSADWDTMMDDLYQIGIQQNKKDTINGWIENAEDINVLDGEPADDPNASILKNGYENYKRTQQAAGGEITDAYTWASTSSDTSIQNAYLAISNKYDGKGNGKTITTYTDENYYNAEYDKYKDSYARNVLSDTTAQEDYNTYVSGITDGSEPDSFYTWATTRASSDIQDALSTAAGSTDNPLQEFGSWKQDKIKSDSWIPNESSWKDIEGRERTIFLAYRESTYKPAMTYDTSKENIIDHFNQTELKNKIGNLETESGVKFDVSYDKDSNSATITAKDADGNTVNSSVTVAAGSKNNAATLLGAGGQDASTTVTQISTSTKLSELGADPDENGNYGFTINGVNFSFDGDTTVNDMMKKVNASSANVKMTFSALENRFTITSNNYGVDAAIDFGGTAGDGSLLKNIGLDQNSVENGANLIVSIKVGDGEARDYETTGNAIEVDGNTFTVSNKFTKEDGEVTVTIGRDTSAIKDLIKDFVKDYNQLIEDVYKYLDEKPEKDYYFLTDTDKEDLDLTEKQEEKWEEKSKKGLLYHDSLVSTLMTSLRTSLMGSVDGLDGSIFSLSSMGIKTVSDYNQHGKIADISDSDLDNAIENHLDDIQKLFSDSENGIMKKFSAALDAGIGTTGENKGTLIRKAGLASGSTAKNNEIYNAIKRTKTRITSLNMRYKNEQNRLWKRYSAMESMLGTLNSQQTSFSSYFMQ